VNQDTTRLGLAHQNAVDRARQLIAISVADHKTLAATVGARSEAERYPLAYFYARHTIDELLGVIDHLTAGGTQ
jgi:hypothetical protein